MSTVDDRVVGMRFNNSSFEQGVRTTISTISKLKKSLDFSSSTKSVKDLQSTTGQFNMGRMGVSVDSISKKFLALSTIAITALSNITNRAINAGGQILKSLTIAPIMSGFHEYETQMGAIQTILANTGLEGSSGLNQVNKALNDLNLYADKTIYNFTEMTRNIGTFTAAGIKLTPATLAIKGIANLAAVSGSNAQQASTAMYQLSQAMASGTVKLMDWNSVVNAGMGGKVFQEALFNTAKQLGTIKDVPMAQTFDQWKNAGNTFRDSLKDGWVTSEVLTQTLSQFTGDLTDAQLRAKGYTEKQIRDLQKQAKMASDAATKVKTLSQLMDTLKEAVGSGWAQTFQVVFGNFNEAKKLFTNVSNVLGGFIAQNSKARIKVLKEWKAMGGRTRLIDGIRSAFEALIAVLKPIKDIFREFFPKKTGAELYALTDKFAKFMEKLKIGEDTADGLRKSFAGVFALFDIGKQIVSGIMHVIGTMFGALGDGSGSFLDLTGSIGRFLVKIDRTLQKSGAITNFFNHIADILAVPIALLSTFAGWVGSLFDGFRRGDANSLTGTFDTIDDRLRSIDITGAGEKIRQDISAVWEKIKTAFDPIKNLFSGLGATLRTSLEGQNFGPVLTLVTVGLLGGLFLIFKNFFGTLGEKLTSGGGLVDQIKEVLGGLTDTLKSMQRELQSKALLNIAKAVSLLAAAVIGLSVIDPKKMKVAFQGLTVAFVELLGSMIILTKTMQIGAWAKVPTMAAAMVTLAVAVDVLSIALIAMSALSWEKIEKGLTAVAGLIAILSASTFVIKKGAITLPLIGIGLTEIAVAMDIMAVALLALSMLSWEKIGKGLTSIAGALIAIGVGVKAVPKILLITAGVGINEIAVAMNILYLAMLGFSHLSWENIGKGIATVGAALVAISIGVKALPKVLLITAGIGLNEIAVAMNILYLAIFGFSHLSWEGIGKGIAGIAGALVAVSLGMRVMPKGMMLRAAALNLVGTSLLMIGHSLRKIGELNQKDIGKALLTIASSLTILAGGLHLMAGTFRASAALLVASGALILLGQALAQIGALSWKDLLKGLVGLAAALGILGLAALVLSPVTTAMFLLGAAVASIGAGVAVVGFGLNLIASALATLSKSGAKGMQTLSKALVEFFGLIPEVAKTLAMAMVDFLKTLADSGPQLISSIAKILEAIMQAIIRELPTALRLFTKLISTLITAVQQNLPKIVSAGINLIIKLLDGIARKMPDLVTSGVNVMVKFLEGLGKNARRIVDSGFNLVIQFMDGLAGSIREHTPELMEKGANLIEAILEGIAKGIWKLGPEWLWKKITGFFSAVWDKITDFFGIGSPSKLAMDVGVNIVKGIWEGVKGVGGWLWDKMTGFVQDFWNFLSSPFAKGLGPGFEKVIKKFIEENFPEVTTAATNNAVKQSTSALEAGLESIDVNPTITPVLDLTSVQKDASKITGYLTTAALNTQLSLTPSVSIQNARAVSTERQSTSATPLEHNVPEVVKEIKFEQNNYSPKALPAIEIYRQTNNQLRLAKEVLT